METRIEEAEAGEATGSAGTWPFIRDAAMVMAGTLLVAGVFIAGMQYAVSRMDARLHAMEMRLRADIARNREDITGLREDIARNRERIAQNRERLVLVETIVSDMRK